MQNTVHQGRIIYKIVDANEMIRPESCQWEAEQTSFDIWRRKRPENLMFIRMNCQKISIGILNNPEICLKIARGA